MTAKVQRIVCITPDRASGERYADALESTGAEVVRVARQIAPRVVQFQLTTNVSRVIDDLSRVVSDAYLRYSPSVLTIACNTLSLPLFVTPALEKVTEAHPTFAQTVSVVLTFPEIERFLSTKGAHYSQVVAITTQPVQTVLFRYTKQHISTLIDIKGAQARDMHLVQEIIWRVKAVHDSDVSTAPEYPQLFSPEVLRERVETLAARLEELGLDCVILACTELPIAFENYLSRTPSFVAVDPATLVAERIMELNRYL